MDLLLENNRSGGRADAGRAMASNCCPSYLGGDLGSRGLSLVGAAEGLAAQLDALDSQALPDDPADGETAAGHQCTANRPAIEGEEEPAQTAYLRAHQARLSVEASHPGEDR